MSPWEGEEMVVGVVDLIRKNASKSNNFTVQEGFFGWPVILSNITNFMDIHFFFFVFVDSNTNSYIWINVFEMLSKYIITVAVHRQENSIKYQRYSYHEYELVPPKDYGNCLSIVHRLIDVC